jgi:hypothetical protein
MRNMGQIIQARNTYNGSRSDTHLRETKTHLEELIGYLEEILKLLTEQKDEIDKANAATYRTILQKLGVTLTVEGGELTDEDWTEDRLKEAFQAVIDIIKGLARFMFDNDEFLGLLQFIATFGGVTIQLTKGSFEGSESYASTLDGNKILLYTQPTRLLNADLERCRAELGQDTTEDACEQAEYARHTARNIVHEFGHILSFKLGDDIKNEWYKLKSKLNVQIHPENSFEGFETSYGWESETFDKFENRSKYITRKPDGTLHVAKSEVEEVELEQERIANIFQAAIYDYEPWFEGDPKRPYQRRAAWLIWMFMTGECPPEGLFAASNTPPCGDEIVNLKEWITRAGE